jgi:hypothetical protein
VVDEGTLIPILRDRERYPRVEDLPEQAEEPSFGLPVAPGLPWAKNWNPKIPYLPAKDSAAFAANVFGLILLDSTIFISCQSYANSFPQPRQAT